MCRGSCRRLRRTQPAAGPFVSILTPLQFKRRRFPMSRWIKRCRILISYRKESGGFGRFPHHALEAMAFGASQRLAILTVHISRKKMKVYKLHACTSASLHLQIRDLGAANVARSVARNEAFCHSFEAIITHCCSHHSLHFSPCSHSHLFFLVLILILVSQSSWLHPSSPHSSSLILFSLPLDSSSAACLKWTMVETDAC